MYDFDIYDHKIHFENITRQFLNIIYRWANKMQNGPRSNHPRRQVIPHTRDPKVKGLNAKYINERYKLLTDDATECDKPRILMVIYISI